MAQSCPRIKLSDSQSYILANTLFPCGSEPARESGLIFNKYAG